MIKAFLFNCFVVYIFLKCIVLIIMTPNKIYFEGVNFSYLVYSINNNNNNNNCIVQPSKVSHPILILTLPYHNVNNVNDQIYKCSTLSYLHLLIIHPMNANSKDV